MQLHACYIALKDDVNSAVYLIFSRKYLSLWKTKPAKGNRSPHMAHLQI